MRTPIRHQGLRGGAVATVAALSLGLGAGIAVGGCGEDRGSLEVEDSDTGSTGGEGTVGTMGTTGAETTTTESH
jgi:hypothetical protein